jgi:GNAT superfamily N-acetyltransferase
MTALAKIANAPKPSASILKDLVINHGPTPLLGQFFLRADAEARKQGVHIGFASCADMVAANERNRDNWLPLIPLFDPNFGGLNDENSFCVLGWNAHGDVVTANAARFYDWQTTNLVEEARSLRLFYDDPERMKVAGERCEVTAAAATCIAGRVAYVGAAWVRPDFRGRGLSETLPRFAKAYALTQWGPRWITSLMTEATHRRGFAERFGYNYIDWEVLWSNSRLGDLRCAVLWMDMPHLVADLTGYLGRHTAQVDGVVLDGRAKQSKPAN